MAKAPAPYGRQALLQLRCPRGAVPPKKIKRDKRDFLGSPAQAAAGSRSATYLWVPREKRGRKGENIVTEGIQIEQTRSDGSAAQQGITGGARYGAERAERKPMVSWAALLDEAVRKAGYIHEAYSRFHNYSLGNQLLALFQCFERGIEPGPLATFPK